MNPDSIWGIQRIRIKGNGKVRMTVPEAIKAATLTAAEALGMSHRIGTIEAGKNADLLVVKDPLPVWKYYIIREHTIYHFEWQAGG